MKGKIFKYDKATQSMIPVSDANVIPLLESKNEDGTTVGFGLIEVPVSEPAPLKLNEEQRENLRQVLRKADQHAEDAMERRDCIRVQERIAMLREQYGIDE
jgi:uncharacterized membrane protein